MKSFFSAIFLTLALSFGVTAVAQDYEPAAPDMTQPEITDKDLEKFIEAQGEINTIREDFSARLTEAPDSQAAQELQSQANVEMTQAVEDAGLEVDTFNRIAVAVQENPALQERVAEIIE